MIEMKKSVAAILAVFILMSVFAACGKNTAENETAAAEKTVAESLTVTTVPPVTDLAGNGYYAVTNPDGSAVRDGEGNMAVYATDANGGRIEGKTEMQPVENAVVIGKRIEMPGFSIAVPEGWSDARSYNTVNLGNDKTLDILTVEVVSGLTFDEIRQEILSLMESVGRAHDSAVISSEEITVCGEKAYFESCYVEIEGEGTYMGYITFAHGTDVYDCRIMAERLPSEEEIDEIVDILNSIEFVR